VTTLSHCIYKELVNFQNWSTDPNHPSYPPYVRIRGPCPPRWCWPSRHLCTSGEFYFF
jgi:hypothetical protein